MELETNVLNQTVLITKLLPLMVNVKIAQSTSEESHTLTNQDNSIEELNVLDVNATPYQHMEEDKSA
jgi:hypothetical protein